MKYTLSFYAKENKPYFKHLKWFEFWKKNKLVENHVWVRKIANIDTTNEDEVSRLFNSEIFKEVLKQTHNEPNHLQLEMHGNENINYMKLKC